jgi:hypothetical protein
MGSQAFMTKKYGIDLDDADNEVYEAAKELIEQQELSEPITSEDIKFVIEVMKKEAPYDEISIKQLFYGMNSAFTRLPIHHNVNSKKSGAGKSYDLILVAEYFPHKYVLPLTGMSNKAILHEEGMDVIEDELTGETEIAGPVLKSFKIRIRELETAVDKEQDKVKKKELFEQLESTNAELDDSMKRIQKLIILDNRIILLMDTAQDSLYNALMSLISQDIQGDQKYKFVEQSSRSGKFGTTTNRLRGIPAIFTTQVIDDTRQARHNEKNRRFVHVNPDTSIEKIDSAMELIGQKYGLLQEEYDEDVVSSDDKKRVRKIIDRLVEKLINHSKPFKSKESGTKIAFTMAIKNGIGGDPNDVWRMTVMDRLMRYLIIITKINMDSRPRLIDTETEGKFYPITTFGDLRETLQLMGVASSTLRPYVVEWYNQVFLPAFRDLRGEPNELKVNGIPIEKENYVGVNYTQLAEKTREVRQVAKPGSDELHKNYLYPLLNLGFINKTQSVIDRRANIYSPVEENNIFTMFQNGQDFRLAIADSTLFPTRQVLEEHFRRIVKYRHKDGVRLKFKLVDEKGVEISVEELVDRYLNNPEICFSTEERVCGDNLTDSYKNKQEENVIEYQCWKPQYPQLVYNTARMPSLPSPLHLNDVEYPPKCYHCIIRGFSNKDHYEEHVSRCHNGLPGYPGPADLEKHKLEPQGMYWEDPGRSEIYFENSN